MNDTSINVTPVTTEQTEAEKQLTTTQIQELKKGWEARVKVNGWKPNSKTYNHYQLEFMCAAMITANLLGATGLASRIAFLASMASVGRDPFNI